ncbi:TldD/PmbA family protein [Nannocystis sp. ILAH1]|uniref:TldD/PmbA family protein n=1 Tax=unclassified Nannocystis TaxID=2627009 RepID=UPI002271FAE7|nr:MULTISPECIES: TldD/PmbA family protein [unclassified Nannocystis]MCY0993624.1 TldD/PmbA family protein [Nannocystis sp. ILAH1]MCY1063649.1 TldD/PmbA family protein [Nannocystis sp. RBIL2]
MSSSRRSFLALTGLCGAEALLHGSRAAWAGPAPSRIPAPKSAPASADAGMALLAASRLLADESLLRTALAAATKAGASYADARLVLMRRERVGVRDDHVSGIGRSEDYGVGLRVIADGGWGFAATAERSAKAVEGIAKAAVAMARQSALLMPQPVTLAPAPVLQGGWVSPFQVDPFSIAPAEKAELLLAAARAALAVPGVAHVDANVACVREEKLVMTSEGSRVHQIFFRVIPGLTATAIDRRRGRFAGRDHEVAPMLAGWEHVTAADLVGSAPKIAEEALQKLHAAPAVPGKKHAILAPSNLWLTIHESIGHSTELDRALGYEANYAGTSFLGPDRAGKVKIGSEIVNLAADRTQPGGLATTAWDDEAVASQRWDLVKKGTFVGWQTTRDLAAAAGEQASRGCSYADSYASVPFQRMPNVSLQPGTEGYTTEDLISATDDGVLITGRGSWSIDQQRYNFQFSGQFFWEIKNGRLTRPLRDVAYQANTVEFWSSCDMLGGTDTYRLGGSMSDGKGEPSQSNAVSHGCPPARFVVNILNTGGDK